MKKNRKALIFGVTGQDGAYLADFLCKKKYQVYGTSRNLKKANLKNLFFLNVQNKVKLYKSSLNNFKQINNLIKALEPDEIYNLSGQSSVHKSFSHPFETYNSNTFPVISILESIKKLKLKTKFYNASSGEIYGNSKSIVNEKTQHQPISPYGLSKSLSMKIISSYRSTSEIFACSGIAFNHESILRRETFVTKKIICGAKQISINKKNSILKLGNIEVFRDWGWAPEYVEAMWLLLQKDLPHDIILATGKTISLKYFLKEVFSMFKLDWKEFVQFDSELKRPSELYKIKTNPTKASEILGWKAKFHSKKLIDKLVEEELKIKC